MRSLTRCLFFLGLVLLAGAPAHAQLTEKQAGQQMRKAAKQELKVLRQALSADRRVFAVELERFEIAFPGDAVLPMVELSIALEALIVSHRDAHRSAISSASADAGGLLGQLILAVDEPFPRDFRATPGGAYGDFRVSVREEVAKSLERVRRSLAKTAKRVEKRAGLGLGVLIREIDPLNDAYPVAGASAFIVTLPPTRIDAVLTASFASTPNDGILCMSGSEGGTQVNVSFEDVMAAASVTADRFRLCASGSTEGNVAPFAAGLGNDFVVVTIP